MGFKFNPFTGTLDISGTGGGGATTATNFVIEARNSTGSTIAAGSVVYISGATGNKPNIVLAKADSAATSDRTLGIVESSIANNANGNVVVQGVVENLNTNSYTDGDILYLSTSVAGGLQTTIPTQPLHTVIVGVVSRAHPTLGTIVLTVQNGYEISDLHDVLVTSIADGQTLRWDNSAMVWKNVNPDTAFTTITTTGTSNNFVVSGTYAIRFAGASQLTITGITSSYDGRDILFINDSAGTNLIFTNESASSTAANRFSLPGSGSITVGVRQAIRFKYNGTASRWYVSGFGPFTASAPLSLTAANVLSMSQASTGSNGWLSSTNWNTFNNKLNGSGVATNIAYFDSSTNVTSETNKLTWDAASDRLGVQVAAASAEAAVHVKSITTTPIGDPTSFTASLQLFTPLTDCTGSAVPTQGTGRLMPPTGATATENASGASPWSAADTMDYYIQPYYNDGGTYRECAATTLVGVTFAGSNNGVDLSWSNVNTGTVTRTGYILYRNYNGGGFVENLDIGAVTSYTDNNQDTWNATLYPGGNYIYDDYLADGTTRDYNYYSRAVIGPGTVYSPNPEVATTFTDDNSGNPFRVIHNVSSTETLVRIIGSVDGSSYDSSINGAAGVNINEYKDSWVADSTTTPTSVGYVSDDVALNINYAAYKFLDSSGNIVYSNAASASSVDPNDGNTYYVALTASWANPSSGVKILSDVAGAGKVVNGGTSATIYDTNNAFGVSDFPNDTTVTPTGIIPAASIYEKDGNTNSASWLTVKGTSNYSRMDFVSSSNAKQLQIESDTSEGALKYNGTKNIRMNATQLGVYGVTPVARATTGGAASTFTANTSGIADDTATYDGYTIGQIVKALRNIGVLT